MSQPTILDRILSIAVILGCVSLVYLAISHYRTGAVRASTSAEHAEGDRIADVPVVAFQAAPATLVLWIRSTCQYCTKSMDLYRRLAVHPKRVRVVVMGTEPEEVLTKYLQDHGVSVDQVVSVERGVIKFFRTPVLALVGSDRTIRRMWVGMLRDQSQERELLKSIE